MKKNNQTEDEKIDKNNSSSLPKYMKKVTLISTHSFDRKPSLLMRRSYLFACLLVFRSVKSKKINFYLNGVCWQK